MPRRINGFCSTHTEVGKMIKSILSEAEIKGDAPNIFYPILALNYLIDTLNVNSYKKYGRLSNTIDCFLYIKKVAPIIKFIVYEKNDSIFIKYYNESTKSYKRIGNSAVTKNCINKIYNNLNPNDNHYFLDFYRSLTENLSLFTYNSRKVNDSYFEYYAINQNLKGRFDFETDESKREIISFTDKETKERTSFEDYKKNLISENLKKYQEYTKYYYDLNEQFELLNKAQGELNIYTDKHQELDTRYQKLNEDYRGFANEYTNILDKNLDDEMVFININAYYLPRFFNIYQFFNERYGRLNAEYDNLIKKSKEKKDKENTQIANESSGTIPQSSLYLNFNPQAFNDLLEKIL